MLGAYLAARVVALLAPVVAIPILLGSSVLRLLLAYRRGLPLPRDQVRRALLLGALTLAGIGCLGWAGLVEPYGLEVSETTVASPHLGPGERLRIVHLTDTHLQGSYPPVDGLAERLAALQPDLVVFTGDAATTEQDLAAFNALLRRLPARLGRYAVRGNHELSFLRPGIFEDAAVELTGAPVTVPGTKVTLCGAPWGEEERVLACLERAPGGARVVAFHTPDAVEEIARLGPDLYLAGHTHGGQIRLPLLGAIVVPSRFDKRYEAGLYRVAQTALYVSRGLGMEPQPAPQLRFLCRPEIAVIDLVAERRD